jgi:hypothetical protein
LDDRVKLFYTVSAYQLNSLKIVCSRYKTALHGHPIKFHNFATSLIIYFKII